MRISAFLCLLAAAALLSSCSGTGPDDTSGAQVGVFEEAPCPMTVPEGVVEGEDIVCGYVTVPEHHASPDGRTFRLAVAKVTSLAESPLPDPLVPLPTGPGESALDSFLPTFASDLGTAIRATRDVVIFEQRGLYHSEPNAVCDEAHSFFLDRLTENLSGREGVRRAAEAYAACGESLRARGVRLEALKYTESADDLVMVLDSLGYGQANLVGVSAGTMLGQRLLRRHSDRLRSVVLSSVPRIDQSLHASWPAFAARSLRDLFDACAADAACRRAYPDLEKKVERTVTRLNEAPVTVTIDDPRSDGTLELVVNGDRFAEAIFVGTYMTGMIPQLPALIEAVDGGHEETLAHLPGVFQGPGERFAWALGYSVFCSESPAITEEGLEFAGLYPAYEEAVANMAWGPRVVLSVCEAWGLERLGAESQTLATSHVPTLLISGEFDSITPAHSAAAVAGSLENAIEHTVPGAGHSAIENPCALSIFLQFLNDPTTGPDASCLDELPALQFMVGGAESS
jgi:pimeloyl-ACP methyl ester carboxylesterase